MQTSSSTYEQQYHYYKSAYFLTEEELESLQLAANKIPYTEKEAVFQDVIDWMSESNLFPEITITASIVHKEDILADLVGARLSADYIERHTEIRRNFLAAAVSLESFTQLLVRFHEGITKLFIKHNENALNLVLAYKKFNQIDLDILAKEYREKMTNDLEKQNEALRELSTPVAQIWENILLLPLVGFIDSKRSKDIMEAMLDNIADKQAKFFILDISGVAIVDTAVANHLIKMTKAARLMGAQCIISGISGNIAQTIVELGIAIDEIETTGSMKDALKWAIKESGNQL
ncbi:anti-anti-sigma regulatory factor (antagonist of anti-sigma factor) [Saprospira grandis DSM 2844]|uniref:Anti-anti-sigma regulatory factor (Antagonist of anti-sigma factor) n=1 Tax=Saprospira grandis DSM 2844 TaxID=694433 RepID=J0NWF7_9BACT|nr:STAS domain-containing protein [Saprospira grandis]EJF51834.1 anti-anti-sigma regulatory factor (antagonist of anti-sigma factor) [Saprospira grandis DSM 2844]